MYEDHTVGVVIPAYNEGTFVGEVIETLPAFVDRAYVIDDRSTDDTWREIERAAVAVNGRTTLVADASADEGASKSDEGTAEPSGVAAESNDSTTPPDQRIHTDGGQAFGKRIVSIRHERNRGVGGAIKTGYARAREDGLDVVAVMNGDGQMDPDILDRILDPVVSGRAAYAKGNRLASRAHRAAMPSWRLFGNRLLTALTKCVSGYWGMNDPQNGYTAISTDALDALDLSRLYDDYGFCNDLLVHLNVHGFRIEDVEMESRYGAERSHIRYARFVPTLSWLLGRRMLWRYSQKYVVRDFHPLVGLLGLGFVGGGAGVAYLGWSMATAGIGSLQTLLSLVVVLLGGFFLTLAMIFDRLANEPLGPGIADRIGGDRQ